VGGIVLRTYELWTVLLTEVIKRRAASQALKERDERNDPKLQ
jgi:hypothetical protein